MTRVFKYCFLFLVLLTSMPVDAQQTPEEVGEANDTQYVQVDKNSPDAVVLEDPDQYGDPVVGLDLNDEVEVLDETKDGYVKVRVKVGEEWKEGWVKESVLGDEPVSPEIDSEAADPYDASKAATAEKGSVGMEPIDTTGMNDPIAEQDPWQHIDPIGTEAKLESNPVPYHLIIPAGIIVVGGGAALALALANEDSTPDPGPPIDDPIVEDPEFVLLNDSYSVLCGHSLLIYPLQNDVGTGLVITGINNAPEGVELLNDTMVSIPASLSEDVQFSITVEDEFGQSGSNTVSISVDPVDVVANNDLYDMNQGEMISGNVLDNDLCMGCEVIDNSDGVGTLEMSSDGEFQYSPPADFWGEVVYVITIQNPCGAEDTSNLVFIISPTDCDLVLADDTAWVNAGEIVDGNFLNNDICTDCTVTSVTDAEGTLEWDAEGNFSYTAPDGFQGQVVFEVVVTDACDQEGTQNLVIIVENPPCAFDWTGQVETTPADCGLNNGTALATEELFGPYNFSWSNGVEGPENSGVPTDTYQLFITDTISGCTDTLEAMVNELPPDYNLDVEILPGECGATDNIQLFSNAAVDNPLTVVLSGSTTGTIDDLTDPAIWLGDLVGLNPGDMTISVWSDEAGPECVQTIDLTLNQAPTPELIVMEATPEGVILDIVNAVFPVEIFVNGEPYVLTNESPAFIEGLPPGAYEVFGVDATGCMSAVVIVEIDGGIQHRNLSALRWTPQNQSVLNWINAPQNIMLQTPEGTDGSYPTGAPVAIPVNIGFERGNWVGSVSMASTSYRTDGAHGNLVRRVTYSEWSAGNQFDMWSAKGTFSIGYAMWRTNEETNTNINGWFADASTNWSLKDLNGQLQLGLRVGFINGWQELIAIPKIQYTFSK